MREILFRVWDIAEKAYLPDDTYCILNKTSFGAFGKMIMDWKDYREGEYFYEYAQIIEQFTGLLDKNGVKIFEGDIVAFERISNFKKEYMFPFEIKLVDRGENGIGWTQFSPRNRIVKVGNIHDNPELLN